jgi:hypothetical protein
MFITAQQSRKLLVNVQAIGGLEAYQGVAEVHGSLYQRMHLPVEPSPDGGRNV